jgi:iron complex transport system ATP-binding protein
MFAVERVSCGYGKRVVLPDVSFSVDQGEIFSILGPNGSGKTTLFKTVLGLLKRMGGDIRVDGASILGLSPKDRARLMAYVPQSHTPPFPYRAFDVVLMGRTAHLGLLGSPSQEDDRITLEVMERLGIAALKDRVYSQLSGGERQLVLIARAIGQQPKVLVMDEPASNLDFGNQARMLAQIQKLAGQGLTVVLTTHIPDHALLCSQKIALITPDRQVIVGSQADLMTEDKLAAVYGIPIKIAEIECANGRLLKTCLPLLNDALPE